MLKARVGSSCEQDKETLLLIYSTLGKSITSYAAPIWNTNASDSNFKKIQTAQNVALRMATEAHKIATIYHPHQESRTLKVRDHSDMLSAQYIANCLEEDHICHGITTQEPRSRPMKEILHSRHHSTSHTCGRVLKNHPPPIADEEQRLNRGNGALSQLRSGHCHVLLQDNKHRV